MPRDWAGARLEEQELSAGVVDAGVAEVDHDLEREHELAVKIPAEQLVPLVPGTELGGLGVAEQMPRQRPAVLVHPGGDRRPVTLADPLAPRIVQGGGPRLPAHAARSRSSRAVLAARPPT